MLPLLIPAGIAIAAIAVAIALLADRASKETLLLVGPRRAGKSTLAALVSGSKPILHVKGARLTHRVAWDERTFDEVGLHVRIGDVPGDISDLAQSLEDVPQPTVLVLVVSAVDLARADYLALCERMASIMVGWATTQKRALVVTHCDQALGRDLPDRSDLDRVDTGDLTKILDVPDPLLCNLTNGKSADFVVGRLIKVMKK